MADLNHTWNEGTPIVSQKQSCGCHITQEAIELCKLGTLFKSNSEEVYRFYLHQKGVPANTQVTACALGRFDVHRNIYLRHLETGWDWPRMMWGKDRCL